MEIKSIQEYNDITNEGVVLVDFYATWCGPCRMLAPIIEEVAEELKGQAKVIKVDVDKFPELVQKFNVMQIPTLVILKNNELQKQLLGFKPKKDLVDVVKSVL